MACTSATVHVCDSSVLLTEKLLVSLDPGLYFFINQGCLTVDHMDDKEEMQIVEVRCLCVISHNNLENNWNSNLTSRSQPANLHCEHMPQTIRYHSTESDLEGRGATPRPPQGPRHSPKMPITA